MVWPLQLRVGSPEGEHSPVALCELTEPNTESTGA